MHTRFPPFKRGGGGGVNSFTVSRRGGGGTKSFGPAIFQFCSPPSPLLINNPLIRKIGCLKAVYFFSSMLVRLQHIREPKCIPFVVGGFRGEEVLLL